MTWTPTQPFNELLDLPPQHLLETREVLKACISARVELARLNAEAARLPNPDVLISSLALMEARASSEIENIVTTHDALFLQASLGADNADPATKEALRYRTAIFAGIESLKSRPLTTRTAIEICRTIKGASFDIRRVPGTTITNAGTQDVIYTPPVGEDVIRSKLGNWERYLNTPSDVDPLVRMAVQHYQFEAIHPFPDGNGRTGRILNILYLLDQNVLDLPILYLSGEILREKTTYYERLIGVTRSAAWQDWIIFMLEAIAGSALAAQVKVGNIRLLMAHTQLHIRRNLPKLPESELANVIFRQPYCRISDVVAAGIAQRQTASEYLNALVGLGILEEFKSGREKLFLHASYARILADRQAEVMEYGQDREGARPLFPTSRNA